MAGANLQLRQGEAVFRPESLASNTGRARPAKEDRLNTQSLNPVPHRGGGKPPSGRRQPNLEPAPLRLTLAVAALLAAAMPAAAVAGGSPPANPPGQGTPPQTPPGQNGTPSVPADPPGQLRQDAANPASHHPPAPGRPEARQNRGNGDAANGCTGSIKTTVADGSVANANYQIGQAVYFSGSNFPAGATFNFAVMHVQTKTVVASGSFTGGADGSFLQQAVQHPALTGHEYKVIASYNAASGHRCHKSDNFFFVGGEDVRGAERVIICVATGSKKHPFRELVLPLAALEQRQKKAGDISPAPEGGCPTAGEVRAVEQAGTPRQVRAGEPIRIRVTTVPNGVVSIAGAGVRRTATASSTGLVRVTVRPSRAGIVLVRGASPTPLRRIGVLGAQTSGRPLTG